MWSLTTKSKNPVAWTATGYISFVSIAKYNIKNSYKSIVTSSKPILLKPLIPPVSPVTQLKPIVIIKSSSSRLKAEALLFNYLIVLSNRNRTLAQAVALHYGDSSNTCVYFVSQALRNSGIWIATPTSNTKSLAGNLKKKGWIKDTNSQYILKRDICFTTNGESKYPTHSYIFMGWSDSSNTKYAYICDNQGDEYGASLHLRNYNFATPTKEACAYFVHAK